MNEQTFVNTPQWAQVVKRLLRSQMGLYDVTYKELSTRLKREFGIDQTDSNLKAKINNGVLGAQLFLQINIVLGAQSIDLAQVKKLYDDIAAEH